MTIPSKWLKGYEHHDDIDSIIQQMRKNASYKATIPELVRMLEHPALYEDRNFGDLVFVPELLAKVESKHDSSDILSQLRSWRTTQTQGAAQRALFVIVRLAGACGEALEGLNSGVADLEVAALVGLMEHFGRVGSESVSELQSPLALLLERGLEASESESGDALLYESMYERALVFAMVLSGSDELIERANADKFLRDELSRLVRERLVPESVLVPLKPHTITKADAKQIVESLTDALSKKRVPANHQELVALVHQPNVAAEHADELIQAALAYASFSDSGVVPKTTVSSFAGLCRALLDDLTAPMLITTAEALASEHTELYPLAAEAWARLRPTQAAKIAKNFGADAKGDARWEAAAAGFMRYEHADAKVGELLRERFATSPTPGLKAVVATLPVNLDSVAALVRRARNTEEMNEALAVAVDSKANSLLRDILVRLRSSRFKIDQTMIVHLRRLVDDSNEMWLEAEIDGENPLPDRRKALARARPL